MLGWDPVTVGDVLEVTYESSFSKDFCGLFYFTQFFNKNGMVKKIQWCGKSHSENLKSRIIVSEKLRHHFPIIYFFLFEYFPPTLPRLLFGLAVSHLLLIPLIKYIII